MKILKLKTLVFIPLLLLLCLLQACTSKEQEVLEKGNTAYKQGQKTEAIEYYTQAIEINPQYAEAYSDRGLAKSDLGDNTGAIQDYNKAIQLDPQYADAYQNRGIAKALLEDEAGTFADLEKAKQLFLEQGDMEGYENAIENQDKASDLFAQEGE